MNWEFPMRFYLLTIGCLFLSTIPAYAHKLLMTVKIESKQVTVEVFYEDDTPAEEAKLTVTDTKDNKVLEGITDEKGVWKFPPPKPGNYQIKAISIGHAVKANFTITDESTALEESNSGQFSTPSRKEQTQFPWLRVILGLLAISLASIVFWWLKRKPDSFGQSSFSSK
jgi:nickel transport protein